MATYRDNLHSRWASFGLATPSQLLIESRVREFGDSKFYLAQAWGFNWDSLPVDRIEMQGIVNWVVGAAIMAGIGLGISFCLWNVEDTSVSVGDEDTSNFITSDRWIMFSQEPTVCNGTLTMEGHIQGDARAPAVSTQIMPFVIYRSQSFTKSWAGDQGDLVIDPVLGFLEPVGPGEYYEFLGSTDQIARRLQGSFNSPRLELVSELPAFIVNSPGDYILAVWGHRDGSRASPVEILRSVNLKGC